MDLYFHGGMVYRLLVPHVKVFKVEAGLNDNSLVLGNTLIRKQEIRDNYLI